MNHEHKSARQYNDQIICDHCGKQWDVNDDDPPPCKSSGVNMFELAKRRLRRKNRE